MYSNDDMVDRLLEKGFIETEDVEKAFRKVERSDFTPEDYRERGYHDTPLPLAHGATLSAPSMVAINTELLDVDEDDTVVEIGSGSGYQLAVLSELCEKVIGVEIIPELVEESRGALAGMENVRIFQGSGFQPLEERGMEGFDRVLYSCAIDSMDEVEDHMKPGGVAVAPVNSNGDQILTKLDSGEKSFHGPVRFVPFVD